MSLSFFQEIKIEKVNSKTIFVKFTGDLVPEEVVCRCCSHGQVRSQGRVEVFTAARLIISWYSQFVSTLGYTLSFVSTTQYDF